MRFGGRMWGLMLVGVMGLGGVRSQSASCFSGDPIQATYTAAVLDANDGALYVQASIVASAFTGVTFRYNGSDCHVACTESGCSRVGVSNNNHLEAIVTGGVTDDLAYITGVPTDSLGACGFVRIPGPSASVVYEGTLCADVVSKDCEALEASNRGTSCTKVQVSLPRTLSSVVASQAVGRWSVDKVTVLTDGTAPSTKGGWPTTIAVSVLSPSPLTVDSVDLDSLTTDQGYAIVSPIKSLGAPVGCTGYTTNGQCRQTFNFQVFVGGGSDLCDIKDQFQVSLSGRCQPELGECPPPAEGTQANTQSGSFVLELPRLCATVSLSRFAPKRPSLTLGSGKVVTSPVTLAFGEIAETTVRAVVTAPNEKLCARFNITVPREVKDNDVRLLSRYRLTEVILASAQPGAMAIDATAWVTNYKEEIFLGASSAQGKVWSASFCILMTAGTLPDIPTIPGTSQAYSLRASVSWSSSDTTTATINTRRSLRAGHLDVPPSDETEGAEDGDTVWAYIATHTRELLTSAFLPPALARTLLDKGKTINPALATLGTGSGFAGLTMEELRASAVLLLSVPSSAPSSTSSGSNKKREWTMPDTASVPASDREKAAASSKKVSDGAAFGIAVGVLMGGVLVGAVVMVVLKRIANMPRRR